MTHPIPTTAREMFAHLVSLFGDEKMAAAATRKRFARFNPDRLDEPEENFGNGEERVRRAAMTHGSQALLKAIRRDHPRIVAHLTRPATTALGG